MKKRLSMGMLLIMCLSMNAQVVLAEDMAMTESHAAVVDESQNLSENQTRCKDRMSYEKKMACMGEKCTQHKNRMNELELNWKAAIGQATYKVGDEEQAISAAGLIIEINPGMKILSGAQWDFNLATGFVILPGGGDFAIDVEGPPNYTQNWTVTTVTAGSYIKTNYSYNFDVGKVQIGLENGLGVGYFINNVDWEWVDSEDSDNTAKGSEEESGLAPLLDVALKIGFPVGQNSNLGMNVGAMLVPFSAGDYLNYLTIAIGLNYQIRF